MRTKQIARVVPVVLVALTMAASACGQDGSDRSAGQVDVHTDSSALRVTDPAAGPPPSASGNGTERSDVSTTAGPDAVFSGLPSGVSDSFLPVGDTAELFDTAASTVVGRLSGHEVLRDPTLAAPGYSGPEGVLRLYFEVDSILDTREPVREAPGKAGTGLIAVDTDYWVAGQAQKEHLSAVKEAEDAGATFLLVLSVATIDGETSTGAYTPWRDPLGVVPLEGGRFRPLDLNRKWVEGEAIERGSDVESRLAPPEPGADEPPGEPYREESPLLGNLYGMTPDEVASEFGDPEAPAEVSPPGPMSVE